MHTWLPSTHFAFLLVWLCHAVCDSSLSISVLKEPVLYLFRICKRRTAGFEGTVWMRTGGRTYRPPGLSADSFHLSLNFLPGCYFESITGGYGAGRISRYVWVKLTFGFISKLT